MHTCFFIELCESIPGNVYNSIGPYSSLEHIYSILDIIIQIASETNENYCEWIIKEKMYLPEIKLWSDVQIINQAIVE